MNHFAKYQWTFVIGAVVGGLLAHKSLATAGSSRPVVLSAQTSFRDAGVLRFVADGGEVIQGPFWCNTLLHLFSTGNNEHCFRDRQSCEHQPRPAVPSPNPPQLCVAQPLLTCFFSGNAAHCYEDERECNQRRVRAYQTPRQKVSACAVFRVM